MMEGVSVLVATLDSVHISDLQLSLIRFRIGIRQRGTPLP